jgi:hypothetical protein
LIAFGVSVFSGHFVNVNVIEKPDSFELGFFYGLQSSREKTKKQACACFHS